MYRSSHQRCSLRKGVLGNFTKFTRKHLRQCLFFNKVAGLRPAALLKTRLWHRSFPVNFVKVVRTPFLQNASGRLLMNVRITQLRISEAATQRCSEDKVFWNYASNVQENTHAKVRLKSHFGMGVLL